MNDNNENPLDVALNFDQELVCDPTDEQLVLFGRFDSDYDLKSRFKFLISFKDTGKKIWADFDSFMPEYDNLDALMGIDDIMNSKFTI